MVCDANNLKSKNYDPYDMLKYCCKWCMDNTLWGWDWLVNTGQD